MLTACLQLATSLLPASLQLASSQLTVWLHLLPKQLQSLLKLADVTLAILKKTTPTTACGRGVKRGKNSTPRSSQNPLVPSPCPSVTNFSPLPTSSPRPHSGAAGSLLASSAGEDGWPSRVSTSLSWPPLGPPWGGGGLFERPPACTSQPVSAECTRARRTTQEGLHGARARRASLCCPCLLPPQRWRSFLVSLGFLLVGLITPFLLYFSLLRTRTNTRYHAPHTSVRTPRRASPPNNRQRESESLQGSTFYFTLLYFTRPHV